MPVRLLLCAATLGLALGAQQIDAQVRTVETSLFPLTGSAAAPRAPLEASEGRLILVEAFDAKGRILSIGRTPPEAAAAQGAAKDGNQEAAKEAPKQTQPAAKKTDPRDGLAFLDVRYDSEGRVIELAERKGLEAPTVVTKRRYNGEGQVLEVQRLEKGSLSESLVLEYSGAGDSARALLVDASHKPLAAALLRSGGGGARGLTTVIDLTDSDGAAAGGLVLSWDAQGRLVQWERSEAKPATSGSGEADVGKQDQAKAKAPGASEEKAGAGGTDALPGIVELLFPVWPADAAGIEVASRLARPGRAMDFAALRASGLGALPFDRPVAGRADFLWDGAGRLLLARRYDASGLLDASLACRYDARGLLVEEEVVGWDSVQAGKASGEGLPATDPKAAGKPTAAPKAPQTPGAAAMPAAPATPVAKSITNTYRLDGKGTWQARSSFLRATPSGIGDLLPLEYRERSFTPRLP